MSTPRKQLADMLKTARTEAGFDNHGALARAISMHRSVISKAENPAQPTPSDGLLIAWSGATGVPLDNLTDLAQRCKSGTPDWFVSYSAAESSATALRAWHPLLVPGLLQTEDYARAVLSVRKYPPERLAELLGTRMRRKEVLTRVRLTAVMDHRVLEHCIGSAGIMADQCGHIAAMAEQPGISVHIVPEGTNVALWGAMDMAVRDGATTLNLLSLRDNATTEAEMINEATEQWESILGAALNASESLGFVKEMESQWKARA